MKIMRNVLWLSFACLAFSACAKTNSSGGSSETHFLALCNASCENGFSCLCGVCTESCDDDDACEALNGEASCEVAADGCGTPKVCDVECSEDDDCSSLGASHECEAGHCRAPNEDMMSGGEGGTSGAGGTSGESGAGGASGGSGDGGVSSDDCTIEEAAEHLIGSGEFGRECTVNTLTHTEQAQCIRELRDDNKPFTYFMQFQGIDSILFDGWVGVPGVEGETEYTVYKLQYDSAGFTGSVDPSDVWFTTWSRCQEFTIAEDCEESNCYFCDVDEETPMCGCQADSSPDYVCGEYEVLRPNPCPSPSCMIEGICYPNGESTEDGCCFCENGEYTCIEPGWCPGWPNLGKRCEGDDCGPGLECRENAGGSDKVCTRPCNFGCPSGYECEAEIPVVADQPSEGVCVKPCESHGDCNVGGTSLESLCVGVDPDATSFYCL